MRNEQAHSEGRDSYPDMNTALEQVRAHKARTGGTPIILPLPKEPQLSYIPVEVKKPHPALPDPAPEHDSAYLDEPIVDVAREKLRNENTIIEPSKPDKRNPNQCVGLEPERNPEARHLSRSRSIWSALRR